MLDKITADLRFSIVPAWVLDSGVSDKAVRLYAVLAGYADSETGQAYPGRKLLSKRLDCSMKTVDRAVAELIAAGSLKKQQRVKEGHYQSSLYTVVRIDPTSGESRPSVTDDTTSRHTRPDLASPVSHRTRTTELEPAERKPLNSAIEQFWAIYPRRTAKGRVADALTKALKKASLDDILAGAERYRDDPNREDAFTQYPATWLNAEGWEDDPLPPRVTMGVRKLTNAEQGALLVRKYEAEDAAEKLRPKEIDVDYGSMMKGIEDE